MPVRISRDDVIAFRLRSQRLSRRVHEDGLVDAAGACGIQDSPPGSALLALHARVRNVTKARVDDAIREGSLVQSWCMRGAPFLFPIDDFPVFTAGVLPPTPDAMRLFIRGVGPAVDRLGLSLTEMVELVRSEIDDVLSGRRLAIDELGVELAARIAGRLSAGQRETWDREGPYAAGQALGESVVHFCMRILTVQGVVCFAAREGNKAPFVLVEEWLRMPVPDLDPQAARAELLRRYLRCYGPSTRADFAAWLGVRACDTESWWGLIEDEMTQVDFAREAWILTDDLDALTSSSMPKGVRLLPPRDPYTQLRDRETVVDKRYHRDVWKSAGAPGTVLADGKIIGVWRPRQRGRTLTVTMVTFRPLRNQDKRLLRAEAERLAPLRGASSIDATFDTY